MSFTLALLHALMASIVSGTSVAIGFSQNTCLPFLAHALICRCRCRCCCHDRYRGKVSSIRQRRGHGSRGFGGGRENFRMGFVLRNSRCVENVRLFISTMLQMYVVSSNYLQQQKNCGGQKPTNTGTHTRTALHHASVRSRSGREASCVHHKRTYQKLQQRALFRHQNRQRAHLIGVELRRGADPHGVHVRVRDDVHRVRRERRHVKLSRRRLREGRWLTDGKKQPTFRFNALPPCTPWVVAHGPRIKTTTRLNGGLTCERGTE